MVLNLKGSSPFKWLPLFSLSVRPAAAQTECFSLQSCSTNLAFFLSLSIVQPDGQRSQRARRYSNLRQFTFCKMACYNGWVYNNLAMTIDFAFSTGRTAKIPHLASEFITLLVCHLPVQCVEFLVESRKTTLALWQLISFTIGLDSGY